MNTPNDASKRQIADLFGDIYSGWDGTPDTARWSDVFTLAEIAAVGTLHATQLAKLGHTGLSEDVKMMVECIEDLDGQNKEQKDTIGVLKLEIRRLRAAMEQALEDLR